MCGKVVWSCRGEAQAATETPYVIDASTICQGKRNAWVGAGSERRGCVCCRQQGWRDGVTQVLWSPDDPITISECLLNTKIRDLVFLWCVSVSSWSDHSSLWPNSFFGDILPPTLSTVISPPCWTIPSNCEPKRTLSSLLALLSILSQRWEKSLTYPASWKQAAASLSLN